MNGVPNAIAAQTPKTMARLFYLKPSPIMSLSYVCYCSLTSSHKKLNPHLFVWEPYLGHGLQLLHLLWVQSGQHALLQLVLPSSLLCSHLLLFHVALPQLCQKLVLHRGTNPSVSNTPVMPLQLAPCVAMPHPHSTTRSWCVCRIASLSQTARITVGKLLLAPNLCWCR